MMEIHEWTKREVEKETGAHVCFCVGPQNGEPLCPCQMRRQAIFKRDGRWVRPAEPERDLGPVIE